MINLALPEPVAFYHITELLSSIKDGNRGIFNDMTFSVVDQLFRKKHLKKA